jgi:hypothetical protein
VLEDDFRIEVCHTATSNRIVVHSKKNKSVDGMQGMKMFRKTQLQYAKIVYMQ